MLCVDWGPQGWERGLAELYTERDVQVVLVCAGWCYSSPNGTFRILISFLMNNQSKVTFQIDQVRDIIYVIHESVVLKRDMLQNKYFVCF